MARRGRRQVVGSGRRGPQMLPLRGAPLRRHGPDASYNISFLSRGDATESSVAVKRNHGTPPFDSCAKMPLPFASSTATADVNPTIASRLLIRSGAGPLNEFGAHLERTRRWWGEEAISIQSERVTYSLNLDCARRFDPYYPRLFDSVYYSFRRFDHPLCRFDPVDWPQQDAEKTDIDHLWEIGRKPSTGGLFVSEGDAVLLAHIDGTCSYYDITNCEIKTKYKPPGGVSPNLWGDCWLIRSPGADGCCGRYGFAASAGSILNSEFCSWDFLSKRRYNIPH
ncbi:hypothetical protein ACMD2_26249 [Ananas comosus]|uniref:Uncharacterized protein n=1 Tax=Ananas comosus TaxID=4615 RepID=A0A199UY42_ANACO|nr:hypothetical protein ACMD2_26249 [Ananas comosus]